MESTQDFENRIKGTDLITLRLGLQQEAPGIESMEDVERAEKYLEEIKNRIANGEGRPDLKEQEPQDVALKISFVVNGSYGARGWLNTKEEVKDFLGKVTEELTIGL